MQNLKKLQSIFDYTKPMHKCNAIYKNCNVVEGRIQITNLETSIEIKESQGLSNGLHAIETLLTVPDYKIEVEDRTYPTIEFNQKFR